MSLDLWTESSTLGMSPRLSFSHDLNQSDLTRIEPRKPSLTDFDFDFCVNRRSHDQDSSLADELFENGIILPIQIKRKNTPMKSTSISSTSLPSHVSSNTETEGKQGKNRGKNSFWGFKRSKSLNCGSIYAKGLCPLPILSKSKSAGSIANSKRSLISKDESVSHNEIKQRISNSRNEKKSPLKKKNYGSSIVQVPPVLNVPTVNFLGFGSFLFKAKKK